MKLTQEEKLDALTSMLQSRGWQLVVTPALSTAIENNINMWLAGRRMPGEEKLTEEGLKERIKALKWVLGWEQTRSDLVDQLQQMEEQRMQTEPATDGGTPY